MVDSAFSLKWCLYLIKSGKMKPGETLRATIQIQATILCQAVEWGMRAIQGSFPHIKYCFPFAAENMEEHKNFLHLIAILSNFRTARVALNQLKSTFYPVFELVGDDVLDLST